MSTIHVNGQYDREDYRALIEPEHGFRFEWAAFPIGLVVMNAFWAWSGEAQFGLIAVAAACLVWVYWLWKRNRQGVRKAVDTAARKAKSFDFTIDASGVRYRTPHSSHEFEWQAFDDFSENGRLILLMSDRRTHLWIPKRLMSTDEVDQFRQILIGIYRPADPQNTLRAFPVVQAVEPTHD